MENFKSLSKYEKLQYIQESGVCGKRDRHEMAKYLKALWLNDQDYIQEFEKYGDNPFTMIPNRRKVERQALFGFTEFNLGEAGFLKDPKFINKEKVFFKTKTERSASNYVDLGTGKNGKWTFGTSYCVGLSGGGGGLSIWGEILNTREEALISGMKELIHAHNINRERLYKKDTCGNYNEKYSREIVNNIQDTLDEMLGKKPIQYELF